MAELVDTVKRGSDQRSADKVQRSGGFSALKSHGLIFWSSTLPPMHQHCPVLNERLVAAINAPSISSNQCFRLFKRALNPAAQSPDNSKCLRNFETSKLTARKPVQSTESAQAKRMPNSLLITLLLALVLCLTITKPASAAQPNQVNNQTSNQAKQCAATPAQALAQIRGQSTKPKSALINPNTATLAQLMSLPGVGQTKARAIIAYRQQVGTFSSLDEITQVSGIGDKTYAKFQDRLTLAP